MADKNQMIARQLQTLAVNMNDLEDDELLPVILDVCDGLMSEVWQRHPAISDMDQWDLAQFTSAYANISRHVGQFARELLTIEPSIDTDTELEDAMAELEVMRNLENQKKINLEHITADVENARISNAKLDAKIGNQYSELKKLQAFHESLMEMEKGCSTTVIQNQEAANTHLLERVAFQQNMLKELQKKHDSATHELKGLRDRIHAVEKAIAAVPTENEQLLNEYETKSERLRKLQAAECDCSEENQLQLLSQIDALQPVVDALQGEMSRLQTHYSNLRDAKTVLDTENQTLQTDLLTLLHRSMGDLQLLLHQHRAALTEVKQQADIYRASLAECNRIRDGYQEWFGINREQLEVLLERIDRQENTNLRQTLNLNSQDRIHLLFEQMEQNLEDLDRILHACAAASQKDQQHIERLVHAR